jgi:glucose uptake protein GlcU
LTAVANSGRLLVDLDGRFSASSVSPVANLHQAEVLSVTFWSIYLRNKTKTKQNVYWLILGVLCIILLAPRPLTTTLAILASA